MIIKRKSAKALAVLAGAGLLLTACTTGDSTEPSATSSSGPRPITFTWGYEQEFTGYNLLTADQYSSANAVVMNQVLRGFYYFAPDGTITPDKDFGTYEKTADSPLTVKYTFNPKAAWSDGNPVDCDDAVLAWFSHAGVTPEKTGFTPEGTTGYNQMNKPECKDGDKTFTTTFKTPFADWAALFGNFLPAHILEKQSGVTDIIAAADNPTGADALKAAKFYNTGWLTKPGELKPELMPSAGAYMLSKWQPKQSMTLVANPKWWGTQPKANTIVIRYLGGDQMAQALQNGEINAMDPQPQVELVNQLKALGDKINFSTEDQFTYEHYDFNFGGAFKDKRLREAFAKCLPRQQIIDNLIKPQNPDGKILESRFIFPFQDEYSQFETGVGGEKYNTVDIPGAKALLAAAGKNGQTVRIGWRKDPENLNQRRADTLALVKASCEQAGFKIVDSGTPDFFDKQWPAGNWDVDMFAWIGSPTVTGSNDIFKTGGGQNPGKYSNKEVDGLLDKLATTLDRTEQVSILKQIDSALWTDLATIPLFAHPGIVATTSNAEGVVYNATQQELSWNSWEWNLKSTAG